MRICGILLECTMFAKQGSVVNVEGILQLAPGGSGSVRLGQHGGHGCVKHRSGTPALVAPRGQLSYKLRNGV